MDAAIRRMTRTWNVTRTVCAVSSNANSTRPHRLLAQSIRNSNYADRAKQLGVRGGRWLMRHLWKLMKLSSVIVRRYWIMRCDRWFNEICEWKLLVWCSILFEYLIKGKFILFPVIYTCLIIIILIFDESLCINGLARGAIFFIRWEIKSKISELFLVKNFIWEFFSRWIEHQILKIFFIAKSFDHYLVFELYVLKRTK